MKNLLFILLALAVVTASAQPKAKAKADSLKNHAITVAGPVNGVKIPSSYVPNVVDRAPIPVDEVTNKKLDDLAQAQQIITQRWRDVIETIYGQNKIVVDSVVDFRRDNGMIFLKVKDKPKPK